MITEHKASGPSVSFALKPEKLTDDAVQTVKDAATEWEEKGVITRIDWDTLSMTATNQLNNYSFRISELGEEDYQKNWMGELGLSFRQFGTCLLAALVCFLGAWALASIQGLVRDAKKFVSTSRDGFEAWVKKGGLEQSHLFHDFLLLLPLSGDRGQLGETMADIIDFHGFSLNSKQRNLPDVPSLLTFGACLNAKMRDADTRQKCLFYPVKIWWLLSTIVPLRPVEFLVTPSDCIRQAASGAYFLKLRRDRIKGSHKVKSYKINEDFETVEYQVPAYVAEEILEYKRFSQTLGAASCPLDTLILPQLHYIGLQMSMPVNTTYYTYANFNYAMQRFHDEVLSAGYGYKILSDRSMAGIEFEDGAMYRVLPGDTRHISLINAAKEGVQPQTLAEIVRHSSINQTFWYAANEKIYKATATSQAYLENQSRNAPIPSIPLTGFYRFKEGDPCMEIDDGKCYSPNLNNAKDPSAIDCIQSTGPRGELGWCPSCKYFQRMYSDQFDPSRISLDAQTEWSHLLKTIDYYRTEMLHEDSLISAFEKARTSVNILADLIERDIKMKETEGGPDGRTEEEV